MKAKFLSLTLTNNLDQIPSAVALILLLELTKAPQKNKGKMPLIHSSPPLYDSMKFIIWNTRGKNSPTFIRQCVALIKTHNPDIVALLETKMVDHKHLTELL